jgi:hypothetical protein
VYPGIADKYGISMIDKIKNKRDTPIKIKEKRRPLDHK